MDVGLRIRSKKDLLVLRYGLRLAMRNIEKLPEDQQMAVVSLFGRVLECCGKDNAQSPKPE